jgi:predicted glycoside hydrolase/deacetylase ChbG (UPF0249 family)
MTTAAPSPAGARRLIVNADDFGQSAGINAGIVRCHEAGVVTSASMMVRWPAAGAAAAYARRESSLSVGLHLDLGESICRNGTWICLYEVVPGHDAAIRAEIARQLDAFRHLVDRDPTHIDSHQHVHCHEPARTAVAEMADRLGVPCRLRGDIAYRGGFYGQTADGRSLPDLIGVDRLIALLATLADGTSELGCHPGVGGDAPGMYVAEREREMLALCDPQVRDAIDRERIELISFHDV